MPVFDHLYHDVHVLLSVRRYRDVLLVFPVPETALDSALDFVLPYHCRLIAIELGPDFDCVYHYDDLCVL